MYHWAELNFQLSGLTWIPNKQINNLGQLCGLTMQLRHTNSGLSRLKSPSPVRRQQSGEAARRILNNWISIATLKLVTILSCHAVYQTGFCLCLKEAWIPQTFDESQKNRNKRMSCLSLVLPFTWVCFFAPLLSLCLFLNLFRGKNRLLSS